MTRHQELEAAVEDYLNLTGCSYMKIENYRCFKCGQVQNSKGKGWPDIFVYHPSLCAIEIKVGKDKLRPEQVEIRSKLEEVGVSYIIVRDTVDELVTRL